MSLCSQIVPIFTPLLTPFLHLSSRTASDVDSYRISNQNLRTYSLGFSTTVVPVVSRYIHQFNGIWQSDSRSTPLSFVAAHGAGLIIIINGWRLGSEPINRADVCLWQLMTGGWCMTKKFLSYTLIHPGVRLKVYSRTSADAGENWT